MPTRDELLDEADELGIHVPSKANKSEIQDLIDDANGNPAPQPGEIPPSVDDGVAVEVAATQANNEREAEATRIHNESEEENA